MPGTALQLLHDAIDRNLGVILLMPAVGAGEAKRSRFVGHCPQGVWLEAPPRQQLLTDLLRRTGKAVGVSWRSGEYLLEFQTSIQTTNAAYRLSPATAVEAICLAWPLNVQLTQRRSGYRARVMLDANVKARAWQIDQDALWEATPTSYEMPAELRDLSVTGMGLVLRSTRQSKPAVGQGDRLRVELQANEKMLIVTGKVRQPPRGLPDGSIRLGIDFDGIDRTIEGRRTLAQIAQLVAQFQRCEARRRSAG